MRKPAFFPKLAAQSIKNNRRFYVPYLLTVIGTVAAFYILAALVFDPGAKTLAAGAANGQTYVKFFMTLGMVVLGLFSCIFLLYTNSFLMKRRQKELGLYNVLGMGKGNIAAILSFECLYMAALGIGGGLAAGVLLHKLMSLILYRLTRLPVVFGIAFSWRGAALTAALFAGLLLLTLLSNLVRLGRARPVELLRGGEVGEKEPRTRWLLALVGFAALALAYWLALSVKDGVEAVGFYFVAVFAVILGTYCLFTAGSVVILKALRKNKRYYYKTPHFIGVSGMLYRMKRNAVGLGNICILSTMVMVMVSGTLSMYLGVEDMVDESYPADFVASARFDYGPDYIYPEDGMVEEVANKDEALDPDAMDAHFRDWFAAQGAPVSAYWHTERVSAGLEFEDGSWDGSFDGHRFRVMSFCAVDAQTYALLTGEPAPALAPGQALMRPAASMEPETAGTDALYLGWTDGAPVLTLEIVGQAALSSRQLLRSPGLAEDAHCILVLADSAALRDFARALEGSYVCEGFYDTGVAGDAALALSQGYWDEAHDYAAMQSYDYLSLDCRAAAEADAYGLAGGFLFLGVFLGLVFLMATALIIYYKQVSEGYEDQRRFEIMRQVGLGEREIRRSIRSQVLTVFFLPILLAAVHIAFDFNMVVQLLSLFSLTNVRLTALCTLGTLLAFVLVYALVYLQTAKSYYRIVK